MNHKKLLVEEYLYDIGSEIKIDRAFVFGSYAKGNYNENSDIDLAIFSEAFKDMDPVEGIKFLLKRARKYADVDLQPIAFTKEDYDEPLGIVEDILETGIELHIS